MLRELALTNYRNHRESSYSFSKHFVLVNGPNGSGKTNLIDGIYYLCLCKSYFQRRDNTVTREGADFTRLAGTWDTDDGPVDVTVTFGNGRKKEVKFMDVAEERLANHIGRFPVAVIAPDDTRLVQQYPEERRRFMDISISQQHRDYIALLQEYNKWLQQRNALLKQWQKEGHCDTHLLNILGHHLSRTATEVYTYRREFVRSLGPETASVYRVLSGDKEVPGIRYQSDLDDADMQHLTMANRQDERYAGRTLFGPHRDDIAFTLDGSPFKEVASQGQIKSLLIALKLASLHAPEGAGVCKPVLLLDDIFEKLDRSRTRALFTLLKSHSYSQVFITDADEKRSVALLEEAGLEFDRVLTSGGN